MAKNLQRLLNLVLCISLLASAFPAQTVWAQDVPGQEGTAPAERSQADDGRIFLPVVGAGSSGAMEPEPPAEANQRAADLPRACDLYPIVLHARTLDGVGPGDTVTDILNGVQPGNFGWLSWTGATDTGTLAASLMPPGNAGTYTNPDDPADREISSGDWIRGRPGVANAKAVRDALDGLKSVDITVPIWDQAEGNGANARYRVSDFVWIRLLDYQLPSKNRIRVRYLGRNVYCENDPPVAVDDAYSTDEDTFLAVAAPGVLANDVGEPGSLTAGLVSDVSHGVLTLQPDGSFTYTPDADYNGPDSFTYQANDGEYVSNTATVTLAVDPVNDPPQAIDDVAITDEDVPVTIGVVGNDVDVDGNLDPATVTVMAGPGHGTLANHGDGTLTYTPDADFNGSDSFTYQVCDSDGACATAAVAITVVPVNDAPMATGDTYAVDQGQTLAVAAPGVLANDSDVDGDGLSAVLESGPAHGTLVLNPDGSFSYTPDAGFSGGDGFSYRASDGNLQSDPALVHITVNATSGLPPDPATVAPELDLSVATDMATATEFLYTGDNPIQTGVEPDTIEARRVAVLRGTVLDRDGQPLPGVTIKVLDHPEVGETLSRADGLFDMAVNGGGLLTVNYQKQGYLPAQRQVQAPWRDFAWLPDVVLIPLDDNVTAVDLAANIPIQVARGSVTSDADGTRQATLLFPQGVQAELVLPDGTTQPVTDLSVRATEYTVGDDGPRAMPAELPPQVGYTYAVELSADEAMAAGAGDVRFSQPVYFYVENFLNFPVGAIVPAGYYDRNRGQWSPSDNGRIVQILDVTGGLADLDVDGSGVAADAVSLAELGVTDAEREQLATLYSPGQSLWRVPVTHFTPWDWNWPFGPPRGAVSPGGGPGEALPQPDSNDPAIDDFSCQEGSIIECESQTLREAVPIAGTPFGLYYGSDRVAGRLPGHTLWIPLSGDAVPADLKRIELTVDVAGRRFVQELPAAARQTAMFAWDGRDAYGRTVQGERPVQTRIDYVYDGVYMEPAQMAQSFGEYSGVPIEGNKARQEVALGRKWERAIGAGVASIGTWDATAFGFGGWSLGFHHAYDSAGRVLYRGDGGKRSADNIGAIITTVAGTGTYGYSGDGGPATAAQLDAPTSVAVGADGSLFIADTYNHRIRRVGPDGTITTVAGSGTDGYGGDGGPATAAQLSWPYDVAVGADGSLFISDSSNYRIRRVGPDGIITTVAGSGTRGYSGDGGPATAAQLGPPAGVAVGADGSLFIAACNRIRRVGPDGTITTVAGSGIPGGYGGDGGPATAAQLVCAFDVAVGTDGSLFIADTHNHRIRRVGPDGTITTVAGGSTDGYGDGYSGDGGPATAALLSWPYGVAMGTDGSLFIADLGNHRIRRVGPDGTITTVAGSGTRGYSGDGGLATAAQLGYSDAVAVGADGSLFIVDGNNRIRRVELSLPGYSFGEFVVPAEDGSELYVFGPSGRHLRTVQALTGALLHEFGYDSSGRLISITDGDNNVTTIERDGNGNPTAIVAPFGQRTALSLNTDGYLATISNPAGETTQFSYTAGGLLTSMTDPRNSVYRFDYDDLGRLVRDEDPVEGTKTLSRSAGEGGYTVTFDTPLARTTIYRVERIAAGGAHRVNTFPDGTYVDTRRGTDGSTVTLSSDGTRVEALEGPDPRFGMQAPVVKSRTSTTPDGKTSTVTTDRTVVLADPDDPLSLTTLTDRVSVNGRAYTTVYDAASRTTTRTTPAGRQTTTVIDGQGRVVQEQAAGLLPTAYTYDSRGRLSTITQGRGAEARTTTFSYNAEGYLESITDPLNRTVRFAYDAAGRVIQQTMPDGRVIAFGYDANGNVMGITPPGRPIHSFTYTPVNLQEAYIPPDVGAGTVQTVNSYDQDRALTRMALPTGQTVDLAYDSAGRLSTVSLPRGAVSYSYDPNSGRLAAVSAPGGLTLAYSYDGDLLTTEAWNGTVAGSVTRSYDNDFRVTSISVNGSDPVNYQYDSDSLLTQAGTLTLSRDPQNGLLTGTTLGSVADAWTYNGFGEPQTYDATYGGTGLYAVQYTRDSLGRIAEKTETVGGATDAYGYTYDQAGRLVEVRKNGAVTAAYTYDANGNRLSHAGSSGTVTGTYDDQDRLFQYGGATYTYTANGELLTKAVGGQTTAYQYDELGNLMAATLPDGTEVEYLIDGNNRRIGKKVNGVLVQGFLYQDGLNPVAELDGAGNVVSRFIYASRGNVPDYMIKGGVTYRILADHLGSPKLVVDAATGQIVQQMDFDEFGNVIADSRSGFQPFGFAGGIYDLQTRLVRFGSRDYDAEVGRWTAKDRFGFYAGDTDLYMYTFGDPVNFVDPSGTIVTLGAVIAVGMALVIVLNSALIPVAMSRYLDRLREERREQLLDYMAQDDPSILDSCSRITVPRPPIPVDSPTIRRPNPTVPSPFPWAPQLPDEPTPTMAEVWRTLIRLQANTRARR